MLHTLYSSFHCLFHYPYIAPIKPQHSSDICRQQHHTRLTAIFVKIAGLKVLALGSLQLGSFSLGFQGRGEDHKQKCGGPADMVSNPQNTESRLKPSTVNVRVGVGTATTAAKEPKLETHHALISEFKRKQPERHFPTSSKVGLVTHMLPKNPTLFALIYWSSAPLQCV